MMTATANSRLFSAKIFGRTIRPIPGYSLEGIAFWQGWLLAIDPKNGYLLKIDPLTDNTTILNCHNCGDWIGAAGLAVAGDVLWFVIGQNVYFCSLKEDNFQPQFFTRIPYQANGVAVWETTVYVTCQKNNSIWIFNGNNGELITRFYSPGIGIEKIAVRDEKLWITDNLEQTVYCLVRGTGELIFSVLTPFASPTGIAFYPDPDTQQDILYIAYSLEEPYIRDNPNSDPSHEIQYRDRAFVHPLYFHYDPERRFALSNGYALEMSYVEEIYPLEVPSLPNLEWRIAMPAETERQKIRTIEAIGLPFTEEIEEGQRVAVFKFDLLKATDRYIFGWKAIIDVWSIKYQILPEQCENLPLLSPQEQELYLVDDDELSMDTESVRRAAEEAIARETNILRKVYSIRNYVYDKLSYAIKPYIDTPDIVLTRGTGSCGEYLGLLLALCRLNGIACRTVGRYKCPGDPLQKGIPLQPDFNHVWMEFYLPSIGWLPMESNPDDIIEGGPYPNRFFMGLSWYHAEMGKGIPFETLSKTVLTEGIELPSIGELALNHVTFTILEELQP